MSFANGDRGKKPLDRLAYVIAALGMMLCLGAVILRSWLLANIDGGFRAVAIAPNTSAQTIWLASASQLAKYDGKEVAAQPLHGLGVSNPVADIVATTEQVWLLDMKGGLFECATNSAASDWRCERSTVKVNPAPESGKLGLSNDERWLAITDNERGRLHMVDTRLRSVMSSNESAELYRPNKPVFLDNELLLANTGKHELVSWGKAADGEPHSLQRVPATVIKTQGQPYFFAPNSKASSGWLVLEAGMMLKNGTLASYGSKGDRQSVASVVTDPSSLVADGSVGYLASYDSFNVARVSTEPEVRVALIDDAGFKSHFVKLGDRASLFRSLSTVAIVLTALAIPLAIAILWWLGYDLQSSATGKPLASASLGPLPAEGVQIPYNSAAAKRDRRTAIAVFAGILFIVFIAPLFVIGWQAPWAFMALIVPLIVLPLWISQTQMIKSIQIDSTHLSIEREGKSRRFALSGIHAGWQGQRLVVVFINDPQFRFDAIAKYVDVPALSHALRQYLPPQNQHGSRVQAFFAAAKHVNSVLVSLVLALTILAMAWLSFMI
jgi:hypothetical protein